MTYLILWWVLLLLISFAALPLTMRFLRFLPDRGYAFAKPLALLVWVYPFWLLAELGFLQNSFGALAFTLIAVALVSWGMLRGRGADSVFAWLRTHWRYVVVVEVVFGVAFLAFAYFRAFNPEIQSTEKPMEFMFLNSILSSETFPPRDAWMSGFAISYYYLGYVIVAAIAKLGSVPSGYAFNMGLIMTYAMAGVGAFGLIFNIVTHVQKADAEERTRPSLAPYVFGVIAVFLLLVIGNLQGVIEVAYNANIGSRETYAQLDLHGLEDVTPTGTGIPDDNWWWWRASRVINDKTPAVNGQPQGHVEVIDEFPAFSFLLGDLHPHVLSLPFCVLALAVAFNVLLKRQSPALQMRSGQVSSPSTALGTGLQSLVDQLLTPRMLLTALIVGALGMLNTWDIVTYGIIIAAAFAIAQYRAEGHYSNRVLVSSIAFGLVLFIGGFALFLPFYLGFSSQARGIAPNIFNRTPLHQYLIMWGLFVFVLSGFVLVLFGQVREKTRALVEWLEFTAPLLLVPLFIAVVGAVLLTVSAPLRNLLSSNLGVDPNDAVPSVLGAFGRSFVSNPGTFLLLVILISGIAVLGRLELLSADGVVSGSRSGIVFALLLALVGFVLTFGVEFLYIRDVFESRMNTVFKLYYQGWLLLAMAASFGVFYIWYVTRGPVRYTWLAAFGILFALSLVYPALAYPNRANNFQTANGNPTLDGWGWVERFYPDDYAAIQWANINIPKNAVILEGAGNQYSFDNRVSAATGLATVVGWGHHEEQWRGTYEEAGARTNDVEQIYKTRNVDQARELLDKYGVDYVFVGSIEKDKYKLSPNLVDKFAKLGEMVFEQGSMRIYRVGQVSVSIRTR